MRRPLGQSPRGDMGYVMPNVVRHPMRRSLATARDDNLFLSFRGVLSEAKDAEESHEEIPRFARDDKSKSRWGSGITFS